MYQNTDSYILFMNIRYTIQINVHRIYITNISSTRVVIYETVNSMSLTLFQTCQKQLNVSLSKKLLIEKNKGLLCL